MTDVLHKSKEKGKKRHQFAGWDNHQVQARSLSSSNLGTYQSFSYGSPAPLLTKSLSGNQSAYHVPLSRAVQRSLSSGQDTASFLRRLAREYPLKSEDYEMLNLCGQGATAKVFRARCRSLDEVVAVKQVDLELAGECLDTIILEAQLMSQLRHPNIPTMLACFVEEHFLYMVMPYVVGGSVESAMNYGFSKGLSQDVVAPIMLPVLQALAYLHRHDIIHRDVKASNILLSPDAVVLGDFGIATQIERNLEETIEGPDQGQAKFGNYLLRKSYVGTPVWMAPEVVAPELTNENCQNGDCSSHKQQGPSIWEPEFWVPWAVPSEHTLNVKRQEEKNFGHDMKADIYAFGITLLEMALGKPPYAGMPYHGLCMSKLNHEPPELPHQHEGKSFSSDMQEVVRLCLQRDPAKRPPAAALLKHRFFKWSASHRLAAHSLLDGVPGPVKRLDSLNRRMKESARLGFDSSDFCFAGDERVPLYNIKSKDAAQATQNFGPKEALASLHNMMGSSSGQRLDFRLGGSQDGSSPKSQSLTSTLNTPIGMTPPSRRISFSRTKSFAKGEQWPHLPPAALNHAKAVLFASGKRKGFGVSTSWGHGFVITNLGTMESPCWTGPLYIYLTGSKTIGLGDNSRETIALLRDTKYNDLITSGTKFKLGDIKMIDAVEESLSTEDIMRLMQEPKSKWNGIAFRHYANSKTWKAESSHVLVDHQANAKLYGKPVDPEQVTKGKVPPPVHFRGLIEVLISAQQGRYEKPTSKVDGDSDSNLSANSSGTPSLSRNVSHKSIAKTSTESAAPVTPSNSILAGDVLLADSFTHSYPLNLQKDSSSSPPVPRSSFSYDGSRDLDGLGSTDGSNHSQPPADGMISKDQFRGQMNSLLRVASEPLLPQLLEEEWEIQAGTPPLYQGIAQNYYASLSPQDSNVTSPGSGPPLTSPESRVPLNHHEIGMHARTRQRAIPIKRYTSEVASPPNSAEAEILNPFSAVAAQLHRHSLSDSEILEAAEKLEDMTATKSGGSPMSSVAPVSANKNSGLGRPPKPGKISMRSTSAQSAELQRLTNLLAKRT